jgi:hypothetical protein
MLRSIAVILVLACCAMLSLGQKTPDKKLAKTKVAKQAASKVFSRQFRKSAMLAQEARSRYADSARKMDDKRQWDVYRDETERASVVDRWDDKHRTDAYKDEAERASIVAKADVENLADKAGLLCLMRYEGLVLDSQLARDEMRLWQLKTMGKLVPNSMILDEAARFKEQESAGEALRDMLNEGEIKNSSERYPEWCEGHNP